MNLIIQPLEFLGGVTQLAWRVLKIIFKGQVNLSLLVEQMSSLGVNSIAICVMVNSFVGATFTYLLADELVESGLSGAVGSMVLLILLRNFIPVMSGVALAGRVGAAITSEVGSMKVGEQIDALRALSTNPDWYLTAPRVLAGMIMIPIVAVFSGYGAWFASYLIANTRHGLSYAQFSANIDAFVDAGDFLTCFIKCVVFSILIVTTSCYVGYRAKGGSSGVGQAVMRSVVINITILFAADLALTAILDKIPLTK